MDYLTTDEAATYLRIKERKLYELVAHAEIPCTKVAGKWLFPRQALDRWLEAGLLKPEGFALGDPPPIIGGSHDPLLEWAVRESRCGLAMLHEGSAAGLERLARDEVMVCAIHLHHEGDDSGANLTAVTAIHGLHDVVVLSFAQREQGLVVAADNPLSLTSLGDAFRRQARFALRQEGAGAQLLLAALLGRAGLSISQLTLAEGTCPTGQDLALAIRAGRADCGVATRANAEAYGLGFVPLVWEHYDLVLRRRSFFQPAMQRLLAFLRSAEFTRRAQEFSGYNIADIGAVRLNR